MRKVVEVEIDICDVCEENRAYITCPICGKAFCDNCRKDGTIQLYSELGIEKGSDVYCRACYENPSERYEQLMYLYAVMLRYRNYCSVMRDQIEKDAEDIRCKIEDEQSLIKYGRVMR